jgi:GNAT superfamily N-acetyltransferase
VPEALARHRTLESFRQRLLAGLQAVRVAGPAREPSGFHWVKGDELYQLYVAAGARGTGVAAALLADAETRIAATGAGAAWLACAIGNERAARFYEKHGWRRIGPMMNHVEITGGLFSLEVWRYEKALRGARGEGSGSARPAG